MCRATRVSEHVHYYYSYPKPPLLLLSLSVCVSHDLEEIGSELRLQIGRVIKSLDCSIRYIWRALVMASGDRVFSREHFFG